MKLANLAGNPVIVENGRALDITTASKGRIEPHLTVLSDLTLHDELRNLADSADAADWHEFDRHHLGRVSRPYKAIGVALNYLEHAEESEIPVPAEPSVFAKFASSVVGPYDPIVVPPGYDKVDYEAEVVIVMGATGKNISLLRRVVLRRRRHGRSGHQRPKRAVAQAHQPVHAPEVLRHLQPRSGLTW